MKQFFVSSQRLFRPEYGFCFFNQQISEKYGKKCCRYNQNGQPLPMNKVQEIYNSLGTFLNGWKVTEQGKKLTKYYYTEDYPLAVQFIRQVVKIDKNEFKQCPTFSVSNGQLLQLQLYSITLKGLSMIDFQLAMRINNLDSTKFSLLQIQNNQEYRKEVSKVRMARQSKRIQQVLDQDMKTWKGKV